MRSRFLSPVIVIVICAVMIMVNNARAYPLADNTAPPQQPAGPSGAITPLLQYQGRMTDPTTGQAVADGVYAVTFSLYDVASGGTAKWTETKNLPVTGGLFSTALGDTSPLPQSLFSGQALWLGIKVGSDLEATPRQAILPVAYAFSLAPGAVISGALNNNSVLLAYNSTSYGVRGETGSVASGQAGVLGVAGWTDTSTYPAGVLGKSSARIGVAGISDTYIGTYGYSTNSIGVRGTGGGSGAGVSGYNAGTGYGGDFSSASGQAIYASGSVTITGDLNLLGNLKAPRTRYIPITAGDLMHSAGDTVSTGDCCNGVIFPDGSQSGGPITFPLPDDYVPGTSLNLDLYLIPLDSGSGSIMFWVRFVGLTTGGWSGTGGSVVNGSIPLGTPNYVHKQSFTLPGFSAGSLPELAELNIRRESTDTYAGRVALIGLRLAYQASR